MTQQPHDHRDHAHGDHDHGGNDGHDHGDSKGGHDHAGHAHGVAKNADRRYLVAALLLLTGFMAVEIVIGLMAHSLALLSDAGHMLTDVGSIGLALLAMRLAARPAKGAFTYGLKRVEILSAQANGITLVVLAAVFVVEAIGRLIDPPTVEAKLITLVALIGIAVNVLAVWIMSKANRQSLNVEGSFQHILTDLYAFIATAVGGVVIWFTGWYRVDAIAALIVAYLMLKAGIGLVRESGRVFLEAAPRGLDANEIFESVRGTASVTRVDDFHLWEITSGMPALSAHVVVDPSVDCHAVRRTIEIALKEKFAITHTTLQTDHADAGQQAIPCAFDADGTETTEGHGHKDHHH